MYENLWIKVAVNIFNGPKAKIIDTYEDKRDVIHYVWFRCMTLAGAVNDNGYLYINENMPYTIKTLAIEFNRTLEDVKFAIKVLKKLQMIEYTEDKLFKVKNWTKYQNVEALEKIRIDRNNRVAKHRAKVKNEKFQKENADNHDNGKNESNKNNNNKITVAASNDSSTIINNEENTQITGEDISEETINSKENNVGNNDSSKDIYNSNPSDLENKCEATAENNDLTNDVTGNREILKNNVTYNEEVTACNVTVTDKIKNKKKTKSKKIESEEENNLNKPGNAGEVNEVNDDKDIRSVNLKNVNEKSANRPEDIIKNQENSFDKYKIQSEDPALSEGCARLSKYHESITGRIGGLENGKLRGAIAMHGEPNVKMAIDAAIKVGKAEMNYINGILANWIREGYPKDQMEVKINGISGDRQGNSENKNEFAGFKPKEPRKLTEEQRKKAAKNLI